MKKTIVSIVIVLILLLSSCTSQYTRIDKEAPVITINPYEEEFYLGGTTPIISATCTDDEDETCLVRTPNYPDLTVHGTHTVTFTATDKAGNIATETVTITAIDRSTYITLEIGTYLTTTELGMPYLLPVVTCMSSISETCTVTLPELVPTDQLDSELTYTISGTDGLENSKSVEITIEVVDTTAPYIELVGDAVINIEIAGIWVDPSVNATDVQENVTIDQNISPDLNTVGEYIVIYSATDPSGNVATVNRIVNVVDTTAPVINLVGDAIIDIELGSTWTEPGTTTSDLQTVIVTEDITPDSNLVGIYLITYTATDASDNTATVQRTVNVVDTTDPVITLNGDAVINLTVGDSWTDPHVTTSDLQTIIVTQDITPDLNTIGVYLITYTATDDSGNISTVQRTINVN
ncbi:HYR domain protein [Candidatus Izimaplasma bacterium HR1]|jgi:hypothetical protein|uniref:immunoglobulin-like domain-containing protein n=1 Tax=Candidatus Izimoplasma sp. HR1 TaxID=1541959 RepID=UPI0004F7990F|nr:HYR domain protein [Candidatus Izimaplasma bacterium HR1]